MLSGSLNKLTLSLYSALVILPSASATVNGPVINQNFPDPSIITVSNTTSEFLYSKFGWFTHFLTDTLLQPTVEA